MRAKITPIIILFSSLAAGISAGQSSLTNAMVSANIRDSSNEWSEIIKSWVKSWDKGTATNGLFCGVYFSRHQNEKSPICDVNVFNTTTNVFRAGLYLPLEALLEIELYDSQGKPIEKTAAGKGFVVWTQEQIQGWRDIMSRRGRGGFVIGSIAPMSYGYFSIPQTFQLKQAGEYTLHLRMRLVQVKQDVAKKIYYEITCLPEVVAKVQIRPEDIPPPDLPPNAQTNLLTK